jgi:hypothetical protein
MSIIVTLPYSSAWRGETVNWAKENCPSYITNDIEPPIPPRTMRNGALDSMPNIRYYFSDERDAMWFKLRWA